ncbi:MAG: diaminobutyrate--2-oxoglutarate transaminase [Methylococcales bacterium]
MSEVLDSSYKVSVEDSEGREVRDENLRTNDASGIDLLERQQRFESNARTYPRRIRIALRSARGIHVTDTAGRTYIDCLAGAGALALGHNHPAVVDAVQRALAENLPWQTLDLTTPTKDRFVQDLFASLPAAFSENAKIQFCGPSGADAVEAAIKLVKTATGRRGLLCFRGAYHGMTHGALSITGERNPKESIPGLMPDVQFLPYPYSYRCPFGLGGEACHQMSSRYIENLLDDSNSGIVTPAAMILEAVQGEGGVIPAPSEWLREMRRITRERGILLIVDEVQTGLGRTGRMYAIEHAGIVPDVLVLSKAIGGGLPASVILYHKNLDLWQPGAHAGTFRGNQLALAAGSATVGLVQEFRLHEHAAVMGERLLSSLRQTMAKARYIGDVRGRGLMVGAEIVKPEDATTNAFCPPCYPEMARSIQREALSRGLIVELGGRCGSVVRFLPPLVITANQIDQVAAIFADAVSAAEARDLAAD